jgi:hypothetical protein
MTTVTPSRQYSPQLPTPVLTVVEVPEKNHVFMQHILKITDIVLVLTLKVLSHFKDRVTCDRWWRASLCCHFVVSEQMLRLTGGAYGADTTFCDKSAQLIACWVKDKHH